MQKIYAKGPETKKPPRGVVFEVLQNQELKLVPAPRVELGTY